jgi:hypothetical protein
MEDLDEDFDGESTHASISPPHEVEGLVSFAPSQISEFDDLPCYDLERDNLEDKPLNNDELANAFTSPFDEDNGTLGHEVMDITFHIFYHDRNWDYWKHYGDPIYDAYSDVSIEEIVDFEVYGQPNIEEVNSENLHDIFQPCPYL